MGLDIRLPIGLMFSSIGAILTVYGFAEGPDVNWKWGSVILVFGLVMLALHMIGKKKK